MNQGALSHLPSINSLNSCFNCVSCSVPKVFSTGNQALHCLYISAASLDFPRIVRDSNSPDSTAQNCRR
ncbi:Uncharacterized protein HZ326_30220 [Fusarium oxysporum f. sp. albedinis]|nr:Uncharacterized protein HZ326_30220 [Fusarium oxysporum f. sp. albedinis]